MIGFTVGQEEILQGAVSKWGEALQFDMVVEELAELIHAVQKYKRKRTLRTTNNVIEEIADVEIMIQELKMMLGIYDIDELIQSEIDSKVIRLEGRING